MVADLSCKLEPNTNMVADLSCKLEPNTKMAADLGRCKHEAKHPT